MNKKRPATRAWFWKVNLLAFGLITLAVLLYSLGQVYYLRQTLENHLRDNRQMVLQSVNRQTELGGLAEAALNETILLFLGNTARFLHFLNEVEPFHEEELASFAAENGLAGVAIVGPDRDRASGPAGWPAAAQGCPAQGVVLVKEAGLFFYSWPRPLGGCVLIGYPDHQLRTLQDQFSLPAILAFLATAPEIRVLEIADDGGAVPGNNPDVAMELIEVQGQQVRLGLDIGRYRQQVRRIWQGFALNASFFAGFGLLLSFVLYRFQQQHLSAITGYERELARQQGDAALGRAAATIAHEVRNPLNAIGLGLQRIDTEAALADEQKALLAAMGQALQRTNAIIEGLLRYSRPLALCFKAVAVDTLLAQQLLLRAPHCEQEKITVEFSPGFQGEIRADGDLLAQLFDNIIKNAIEAQPDGGWLRLVSSRENGGLLVVCENGGFDRGEDIDRLTEPYFTGKTRGTGLGLAICARIVESHQGSLELREARPGVLRVAVWLPVNG
jgi:signal transduction histidine kinase